MVLYSSLIIVTLWSGTKAINYAMDMLFYKDYLLRWRQTVEATSAEDKTWPEYTDSMLVAYMDEVAQEGEQGISGRSSKQYISYVKGRAASYNRSSGNNRRVGEYLL